MFSHWNAQPFYNRAGSKPFILWPPYDPASSSHTRNTILGMI